MIDSILDSMVVYMIIGIIVIVGISQLNRTAGSALGIVFWVAVAIVGSAAYDRGGAIGFVGGVKMSLPVFLALCLALVAFNAFNLYKETQRKRRPPAGEVDDADD